MSKFTNTRVIPSHYLRNMRWADRQSHKLVCNDYVNEIHFISDDDYYRMTGESRADWEASFFIDYGNYNMYIPTGMWDEPRPILISDFCHEKQHLAHEFVRAWTIEHQEKGKITLVDYRKLSEVICKESGYLFLLQFHATQEMVDVSGSSYRNRKLAIEDARAIKRKIGNDIRLFDVVQYMVLAGAPVHSNLLIERLELLFGSKLSVENYLSQ